MTHSFNLIDQPWIPCIHAESGELVEVSLRQLLTEAQDFREINCETPIMTAAIFPMVLALLHRVFGPKDSTTWQNLWNRRAFPADHLNAYFEQWYDRFDLFHPERPFYQAHDERVKPKSVIHLIHSIGNTGTLFIHETDEEGAVLSPPEAARYLLTSQYFRTAGLSGLPQKFTDNPFARGVLFWAEGATVFETFMLNLMRYPDDNVLTYSPADQPIWESDNPFRKRDIPYGYLDYLTWPSNRVWLIPAGNDHATTVSQMTIAPGLSLNMEVQSPQKRFSKREKNNEVSWPFLYFNSNKALWRDYDSLLVTQQEGIKPPAVVRWLSMLKVNDILTQNYSLRVMAIGMLADQAKPLFYRKESMSLPLALLDNSVALATVTQAIQDAEDASQKLNFALKVLADYLLGHGEQGQANPDDVRRVITQWDVVAGYWTQIEEDFWRFVEQVAKDSDPLEQWRDVLKIAARDALHNAMRMAGDSPYALKGGNQAERALNGGLKKLFNP